MVGRSRGERERDDARAVGGNECVDHHVKCVGLALECLEGGRDIRRSPDFKFGDFNAEIVGPSLSLSHFQHGLGKADVGQDRQTAQIGTNLAQEFEPFAGEIDPLIRQSSDVTAWSRQARDQAAANRVIRQRKNDGDDRCRLS